MSSSPQKKFPVRHVLTLVLIVVLATAFGSGYYTGQTHAVQNTVPVGEGRVLNKGSVAPNLEEDVDFKTFWEIWSYTKEKFYQQPVSDKALYYGALKGLVSGLDDPYSVYFDPEEAEKFNSDLEESFVGIGAQIDIKENKLTVVAPLENSPAARAGIQPGDWIVLIDTKETSGMSVEEAVSLIRGNAGTEVMLSISRGKAKDLMEIKIVREKITVDSVKWKMLEENIFYISISTFNGETSSLFNKAIQEALSKNAKGIILDVRSGPGGLLTTAIDVASAWVGYEPIVLEKGSRPEIVALNGVTAPRLAEIPTVVLVNGGSASASEIVAGALQDYGLAKLVGTKTFGKGSVQDYRELPDGSALKITVAEWLTPKGRSINKTGIEPDVIVEFNVDDFTKKKHDNQKQTAIDILLGRYKEAPKPSDVDKAIKK